MRQIKFRGKHITTGVWLHGIFEKVGNIHDNPELIEKC